MGMVEYITDNGFDLLNRMLSGESEIQFTRVEMGEGYPREMNYKKVKSLAKPIVSLDVDSVRVSENKTVRITAIFNNTELTEGFYYREKGIYATDGEKEILFSYANAREDAGFIDPPTVCLVEKKIISYMTQLQGTDGEVKIGVKFGIYVSTDDFVYYMSTSAPEYSIPEHDNLNDYAIADKDKLSDILGKARYLLDRFIEHVLDFKNPHKVSKKDVGLDNVSNVSTNDQTPTFTVETSRTNIESGEKLSTILGKIMKFFADLKVVAFSGSYSDLTNKPMSKGSAIQPVYFDSSGAVVPCSYQLNKTVPSDAAFTDTNTWRGIQNNLTSTSTTDSLSANQGKVLKDSIDLLSKKFVRKVIYNNRGGTDGDLTFKKSDFVGCLFYTISYSYGDICNVTDVLITEVGSDFVGLYSKMLVATKMDGSIIQELREVIILNFTSTQVTLNRSYMYFYNITPNAVAGFVTGQKTLIKINSIIGYIPL